MSVSTHTIRRLVAVLIATAATVVAVPVAQGWDGPPDAIDRYALNHPQLVNVWPLGGPPDAIDRYNSPALLQFDGPQDAIDRYYRTDVTLGKPIVGQFENTAQLPASDGQSFAWGEFGIGAGAMLGLLLLAAAVTLGALSVRHRGGQLKTS
jgi:hypothetical protein